MQDNVQYLASHQLSDLAGIPKPKNSHIYIFLISKVISWCTLWLVACLIIDFELKDDIMRGILQNVKL